MKWSKKKQMPHHQKQKKCWIVLELQANSWKTIKKWGTCKLSQRIFFFRFRWLTRKDRFLNVLHCLEREYLIRCDIQGSWLFKCVPKFVPLLEVNKLIKFPRRLLFVSLVLSGIKIVAFWSFLGKRGIDFFYTFFSY